MAYLLGINSGINRDNRSHFNKEGKIKGMRNLHTLKIWAIRGDINNKKGD